MQTLRRTCPHFRRAAVGASRVFDLVVLGLLIAFPDLATWLPRRMIEG